MFKSGILALFLVMSLTACEHVGLEGAKTFNERAAYAHASLNAMTDSAALALNNHVIGSEEAVNVKADISEARDIANAAEVLNNAGSVNEASERLAIAEASLKVLRSYFMAKGVKVEEPK